MDERDKRGFTEVERRHKRDTLAEEEQEGNTNTDLTQQNIISYIYSALQVYGV